MAPHLSIRIVILILLSDTGTLFGDHLFCISSDHPNRETAMLQCRVDQMKVMARSIGIKLVAFSLYSNAMHIAQYQNAQYQNCNIRKALKNHCIIIAFS